VASPQHNLIIEERLEEINKAVRDSIGSLIRSNTSVIVSEVLVSESAKSEYQLSTMLTNFCLSGGRVLRWKNDARSCCRLKSPVGMPLKQLATEMVDQFTHTERYLARCQRRPSTSVQGDSATMTAIGTSGSFSFDTAGGSPGQCIELPLIGHTLQRVHPPVDERQT
jgi:hypothetical protein